MANKEILLEIKRIGSSMRVTAIDASTDTEVVFIVPPATSPEAIKNLAAAKIEYVLNKQRQG